MALHGPRRHLASRRVAALLLIVSASVLGAQAFAQNATFSRANYPFLGHPVIADVNGDGRPDLAGTAANNAAVMLGNGDGTFGSRQEVPVGLQIQDIVAGDFNNDSRLDLVLAINDPATSLSLLLGNGDGTFGAPVNFPNTSGFDSPAIVATDLDGDAWLDLVIGHGAACYTAPCRIAQSITVMLGNGDGTFQPPDEIVVGSSTAEIAVGDFNRDGMKDLALATSASRVHILFGAGDGTFSSQATLTLTADTFFVEATDVDVGDFNGDGIQDLVVAVATNGSRTAILIGRGDGTFAAPHIITEPNLRIPQYGAVADYDGDGFQDLALSLGDGTGGLMEILNGRGDGTFGAAVMYLVPPDRSSISGGQIVTGDFNGDRKPDLALEVTGAFPAFAALTNTTGLAPPPTPAAPTLVSPANDSQPTQPVTFDWTDVSAATAYQIQVDDSSNFSTPRIVDRLVTASTFTSTGIPLQARRHWWRVRGVNSAGVAGAWSTVRRFTPSTTTTGTTLSSIVLDPTSVTGGSGSQGAVTLSSAAPAGGAVVPLTSSNPGVASAPSSVTVPAGSTSASFAVTTTQVTSSTFVTFTGSYGGVSRSVTLIVNPPPAPASLNGVSVNPTSVVGGSSSQGIVGLTAVAPAGGFTVALSSSNAAATVPASVTVPEGSPSATFTVTTAQVSASTAVTITASAAGVTRTTTLTVNPPTQQAQQAALTVSASGRSGERVVSSPAGINVSVGSTGSATFNVGTSITLSVSNGRDAIWSGACSSGGNKTRTCTFALNANASVAANVQ